MQGAAGVRCAFCAREFDPDEPQLLLMRAGTVVGAYHEACRPDRRAKGCSGC